MDDIWYINAIKNEVHYLPLSSFISSDEVTIKVFINFPECIVHVINTSIKKIVLEAMKCWDPKEGDKHRERMSLFDQLYIYDMIVSNTNCFCGLVKLPTRTKNTNYKGIASGTNLVYAFKSCAAVLQSLNFVYHNILYYSSCIKNCYIFLYSILPI